MLKKILLLGLVCIQAMAFSQTEPSSQATNLNFSGIKTYRANASFSTSGSDGHLVVISKSPITFVPSDDTFYQKGEIVNGVKIASVGAGTFTFLKNLLQDNDYYLAVFAYNEQGANINYKPDSPLTGTLSTLSAGFGNYYNGIDFTASNMINQLTNLIRPHTQIEYGQFDENIVADFFETDTIVSGVAQKYVTCQYSNEKRLYSGTFAYTTPLPNYSREHRMAFSWVNFQGISRSDFEETDEGCDVHSLDLVQNDVNSNRSNHPLGEVANPNGSSYLEFKVGNDAGGTYVAEPKEDVKGDVARALFYTMLAYNGKYNQNWGLDNLLSKASSQDIQVLLDWHYNDLPDDFEKTRHEYVYEKQGNRNPLIDFPQLVDCIDFTDMTKQANCNVSVGLTSQIKNEFGDFVYPNPSEGVLYIKDVKAKDIKAIHIYNLLGIEQNNYTFNFDSIQIENLEKGLYIISIESKKKSFISKFQLK